MKDNPSRNFSYVLEYPLREQQQDESRQAQNPDDEGVQQVETQCEAGEPRCQIRGPESQKSQQGIHQQLQRDSQRGAQKPDQGDCKNAEKDAELFNKIAEALAGKNILVLSAREENYKAVGASAGLAYNQKVGAESAVDINLAKQLNTVMTQLGVNAQSIVMNIGSAAAGYGYEYVASTLDRVKAAALQQGDAQLQMPIMTPVSSDAWGVKEATAAEADMPEWGNQEERAIEMEVVTASACLAGGSDAVILRHPEAVATIAKMIDALI